MGKLGTGIQSWDSKQVWPFLGSGGISKSRGWASSHCSYCHPPHPSLPQTVTSIFPKPYFGGTYVPPITPVPCVKDLEDALPGSDKGGLSPAPCVRPGGEGSDAAALEKRGAGGTVKILTSTC